MEINKKIEYHTQQRYPITYTSKGKGKLQTPAATFQRIQPPTWKKTKVELPNNLSYYYTPGSIINIILIGMSTSNATLTFGQLLFQKVTESKEKKEKKAEDQEFTYQNPIPENPNIETLNFQTQQDPNLKNLEFTGKKNNTQVWLNDMKKAITTNKWDNNTANSWYQSLVNKFQDFNAFKLAIQADYFTVPQILNQFIRGLCTDLQAAVINARDFEAAELKANHAQAINLVMNRSSELDSKLKQFSNSINQKLEGYLDNN
ncbi:hypothetical protein G9A89_001123 [Geosiphon pyriformis]|nr:hypothetical protein G9A89_001123 [Geosiphon pyriformis]